MQPFPDVIKLAESSPLIFRTLPRQVTVFDFSEIMERTEKRVGEEILGPGPRNIDELRAIARRVKSKYLMRVQLKEKHSPANHPPTPLGRQIPPLPSKPPLPSRESVRSVTDSVIGGVGGLGRRWPMQLLKKPSSQASEGDNHPNNDEKDAHPAPAGEVEVHLDGTTSTPNDSLIGSSKSHANQISSSTSPTAPDAAADTEDELERLSAELGDLSAATAEAFDLLGDDFNPTDLDGDIEHSADLLDAMDEKIDPFAAFAIDDNEFLS